MRLTCVADESGNTYTFSHGIREIKLPKGYRINIGEQSDSLTVEQWQEPWNGEGLPPVGTMCEYNNLEPHPVSTDLKWSPVHIVAHDTQGGEVFAVFSSLSGYHGNKRPECFRPIRTPEQIEAEERRCEIATLVQHICADGAFDCDDPEVPEVAAKIYDAGYRKQETKPE